METGDKAVTEGALPWDRIRLLVFDVDGTLTDATTSWAGPEIGWTQRYSVRDGEALLLLERRGIQPVPLSRNRTRSARERMEGLGLTCRWLGVTDKPAALAEILAHYQVDRNEVLLVGDGEDDAVLFEQVAIGCAVADAHPTALRACNWRCDSKGGERVMEELAVQLLASRQNVEGEPSDVRVERRPSSAHPGAPTPARATAHMVAIGIMSGTSGDGVDAVTLSIDPKTPGSARLIDHNHEPFPTSLQRELKQPESLSVARLSALHQELSEHYAAAVRPLAQRKEASVCGCHGQTVYHAPPSQRRDPQEPAHTLQIGSSAALAAQLGIAVVSDFRSADVALGGEGAPIAPIAHWFFLSPERKPAWVVNVGGIANFTAVAESLEDVVGYDVGPGMMLSDAWALLVSDGKLTMDKDGAVSRGGRRLDHVVNAVLAHPFFKRVPPKSTGREEFGIAFYRKLFEAWTTEAPEDVAHSILEATAEGLRRVRQLSKQLAEPQELILTGGGAKHPGLLRILQQQFPKTEIRVEQKGLFAPSVHEPAAVALIAARTLVGLPSSLPQVTGARARTVLGHIHPATHDSDP